MTKLLGNPQKHTLLHIEYLYFFVTLYKSNWMFDSLYICVYRRFSLTAALIWFSFTMGKFITIFGKGTTTLLK